MCHFLLGRLSKALSVPGSGFSGFDFAVFGFRVSNKGIEEAASRYGNFVDPSIKSGFVGMRRMMKAG
jgi:hypothetical protein